VRSSSSSTTSSASRTSLDPDLTPPESPRSGPTLTLQSDNLQHLDNTITQPERSNAPSYSPHAVGLGLVAPRRPLPPFDILGQTQARTSPGPQANALESPSLQPSAGDMQPLTSRNDLESISPPSPSYAYVQALSANSSFSPLSAGSAEQRPPSPGTGSSGLRIAIPQAHHPGNPFIHSEANLSPPATSSSQSAQHPELLSSPTQGSNASLDLSHEIPGPSGDTGEGGLNLDFAEFDSEGLSALEKIYLFSRSRAGFQRVFIAHALPGYLRQRSDHPPGTEQAERHAGGIAGADEITPAEAVEYVLPLLNGLAMDEGA
jgi:serine/threonine-protein phosphatase 4 regulatory subunit 1